MKVLIYILTAIAIILFLTVLLLLADRALRINEEIECNQWLHQAETIPNWYSVPWQVDQCIQFDIDLSPWLRISDINI